MLNVSMVTIVMLSVAVLISCYALNMLISCYADSRYAKCCYADS